MNKKFQKTINNHTFDFNNNILVVSDIDGCITNGQFIYTKYGKYAKIFSANDHDGIKALRKYGIETIFVTADKTGFDISYARTYEEMNCETFNYNSDQKIKFIEKMLNEYNKVIYFGDGPNDVKIKNYFKDNENFIMISPANSTKKCKESADVVLESRGGENAFVELSDYIIDNIL